jgi:transcription elongation factor B subunit 2
MYIRVKRRKQTFFLHVEPTDTILEVKSKLQELLEQVSACWICNVNGDKHSPHACLPQPPEKQQLHKSTTLLDDSKKLAELKVENDDVLAVTFLQDGKIFRQFCHLWSSTWEWCMASFSDGTFEAIDIASSEGFEPM